MNVTYVGLSIFQLSNLLYMVMFTGEKWQEERTHA